MRAEMAQELKNRGKLPGTMLRAAGRWSKKGGILSALPGA